MDKSTFWKKKYRMLTCWRVAWMQMVTSRGVWFENTINRTIVISAFWIFEFYLKCILNLWILSAGICWNLCSVVIFNHSQLTFYIFLILKKYIFLTKIGRYNYMFYYKKNIHVWNVRCQSFYFSCFKNIKIYRKKYTVKILYMYMLCVNKLNLRFHTRL